jgi:hypothetical protein
MNFDFSDELKMLREQARIQDDGGVGERSDGTERKRPKNESGRTSTVAHAVHHAKQRNRDQAVNDQEGCCQNGHAGRFGPSYGMANAFLLEWLVRVLLSAIQRLRCFHSTKTPCLLQRGRLRPAA